MFHCVTEWLHSNELQPTGSGCLFTCMYFSQSLITVVSSIVAVFVFSIVFCVLSHFWVSWTQPLSITELRLLCDFFTGSLGAVCNLSALSDVCFFDEQDDGHTAHAIIRGYVPMGLTVAAYIHTWVSCIDNHCICQVIPRQFTILGWSCVLLQS